MNNTYFTLTADRINDDLVTIGVFKNYPTASEVFHVSSGWWHTLLLKDSGLMEKLIVTGKVSSYDLEPVEFEIVEKNFGEPF